MKRDRHPLLIDAPVEAILRSAGESIESHPKLKKYSFRDVYAGSSSSDRRSFPFPQGVSRATGIPAVVRHQQIR
jgi:hypothetical protein